MGRPGLLLYFDILPALDSLSSADAGTLLLAAMHYAQDGREPAFENGTLSFAWAFIKSSVDKDGGNYEKKQLRGRWLTYCRQCKQDDTEPLDFETWRQRVVTEPFRTDTKLYPSTSTSTATATSTATNKNIEADKPPTPARRKYGQYGWVKLTEDEYNRLLSDLGQAELDRCIQYIDESAQGNGNKNRWKDWNLVLRRCHREGWGGRPQQDGKDRLRTDSDYSDGESFV